MLKSTFIATGFFVSIDAHKCPAREVIIILIMQEKLQCIRDGK